MPFQEQTLVEAILQVHAQIDFLWQFFMSVQIAVFALLFIYDDAVESLNVLARMLAIAAIGLFDWINGNALRAAYALLDAFHQQFRADFGQAERFQSALYERFVLARFDGRDSMVAISHGTAFVVVVLALLWRGFIQHRAPERRRATA
jgi:hypothetical protein